MNATPVRIQRSRKKGSKLVSPNGLKVVCCTRPGKYANPFKVGMSSFEAGQAASKAGGLAIALEDAPNTKEESVRLFRFWRVEVPDRLNDPRPTLDDVRRELRNNNLACWCKLCPAHAANGKPLNERCPDCAPCHCDVYGEILYGGAL